jgi:glycosyltransferase involved in cell wall biosynthesis
VLWSGGVGGIERLVHDLATEQARAGVEVSVAFGEAAGLFAERSRAAGLRVSDLELNSGYDLRPSRLARAAAILSTAEIVHAHGFNRPLGAIMRRSGRPIVFTEHGNFALGRRLGVRGALKRRMQRRFLKHRCAVLAANSRWTAERLSTTYGIDADRVKVVYNGINLGIAATPQSREESEYLVVAFVGRLVGFKRVDRIIRAVARLHEHPDVQVVIAGSGPLEAELRSLARELGVEERVRFLGWQDDVATVLTMADILVLPSAGEPFGLAVVEACAQGLLPIAFSDGGGVLENMPPDGRVVQGIEDLASALANLKGSAALTSAACRARSSWARERFPISKTAARYLELYRSVTEVDR